MTTIVKVPVVGTAPVEYDKVYMDQMLNSLIQYFRIASTAGPLNGSTLNLSTLPTSATGLRAGDIYQLSGVLHIVT